ncbi:hypothetical protein KA005_53615 [bacterium]|nr:hypothetical protein [bacterium]
MICQICNAEEATHKLIVRRLDNNKCELNRDITGCEGCFRNLGFREFKENKPGHKNTIRVEVKNYMRPLTEEEGRLIRVNMLLPPVVFFREEDVSTAVARMNLEMEQEISVMDIDMEFKNAVRRAYNIAREKAFPVFDNNSDKKR